MPTTTWEILKQGQFLHRPLLAEYIAEQLKSEAAMAKERREARDERAARA